MWYKRHEAQKRYTFFFASTTLAGAFGGLLASAIGKMNGMEGYLGWRWVFILEGCLTCLVSFIWFFLIPNFPEDAKWLKESEREYVKARLRDDQGKSAMERRITLTDVVNCFKDYKIIVGGFMYLGLIVPGKHSRLRFETETDALQLMATPTLRLQSSRATDTARFRPSCIPSHLGPPHLVGACSQPLSLIAFGTDSPLRCSIFVWPLQDLQS